MKVTLASSYGFCFGVKRAINIAQQHTNSATMGPLIHNQKEINRLNSDFNVGLYENIDDVKKDDTVIIRTHGIPKNDLKECFFYEKTAYCLNQCAVFYFYPHVPTIL